MKRHIAIIVILTIGFAGILSAQKAPSEKKEEKIKWITYKQAYELNKKGEKRKIITDVFTSWCGWCTKMDATTFADPKIVEYINKHYWAVKFDAETKDTITLEGVAYVNQRPNAVRSTHDLAAKLLQNQMSYPTYLFSNESNQAITIVPGYYSAENFIWVLKYINEEIYKTKPFKQYQAENAPMIK